MYSRNNIISILKFYQLTRDVRLYIKSFKSLSLFKESEWRIVNPKVAKGNHEAYEVKHPLPGLEPGSYETRVRSRNLHGWSDFSDVMSFEGGKF